MLIALVTLMLVKTLEFAGGRNVTLYGNTTLGYYYLNAHIGVPPQKKALIVDTGSHATIFGCEECVNCGKHLHNAYEHSKSATFEYILPQREYFNWTCNEHFIASNRCTFTQSYSESSSYSGYYAMDTFVFENEARNVTRSNLRHIFGCATSETNLFYTQEVGGIIGFGVTEINS